MVNILTLAVVGAFIFLGGLQLAGTAVRDVRQFGSEIKLDVQQRRIAKEHEQAARQAYIDAAAAQLKGGSMKEE
ncbi:MAG: hypothetical protein MPL62_04480 [Alphaproteobacteria bacterium]|nr:hypothetical protein [Alphaproteobacteria bacterium]